eukprot:gene17178-biopygen6824
MARSGLNRTPQNDTLRGLGEENRLLPHTASALRRRAIARSTLMSCTRTKTQQPTAAIHSGNSQGSAADATRDGAAPSFPSCTRTPMRRLAADPL